MTNENTQIAIVTEKELALVGDNLLNKQQLAFIMLRTPKEYVKKRPAKGGGEWSYVSGGHVKKCLNLMFGWDWNFEIMEQLVMHGEAIVKGKLTCRTNGREIVKMQFGNKDIMYKKEADKEGNRVPLSIGNDLKAAATDCLKKCASEIGIAADIYNAEEFIAVNVVDDITLEDIKALAIEKMDKMNEKLTADTERIIQDQDEKSYAKLFRTLSKL